MPSSANEIAWGAATSSRGSVTLSPIPTTIGPLDGGHLGQDACELPAVGQYVVGPFQRDLAAEPADGLHDRHARRERQPTPRGRWVRPRRGSPPTSRPAHQARRTMSGPGVLARPSGARRSARRRRCPRPRSPVRSSRRWWTRSRPRRRAGSSPTTLRGPRHGAPLHRAGRHAGLRQQSFWAGFPSNRSFIQRTTARASEGLWPPSVSYRMVMVPPSAQARSIAAFVHAASMYGSLPP